MKVLLIDQIAKVNYKYTFPLANSLSECGIQVDLVIDQKLEKENCNCNRYCFFNTAEKDISKIKKLVNYIKSYMSIYKILKKGRYDIIHTEWYTFSPIDYFFLRLIKKKYIIRYVATVHDILPFNQKFYDAYYHKKLYKLADSIILQAPANMDRFVSIFPEEKNKIHMIPHGHMLDYVEIQNREESRKRLGLPDDKVILLFFGQIKKVKGVEILLSAIGKLKKKHPNLYTVVAGSVWKADFSECEQIIEKEQLNNCLRTDIRYISDEEVKYYYSACDICVLPYTDVYQSGVIQLAYGYKKPVIATELPAFTQFVKENITGFLSKPGDAESLALAIEKALQSKRNLNDIGEAGYQLVRETLDWNVLAKRIVEECYKE